MDRIPPDPPDPPDIQTNMDASPPLFTQSQATKRRLEGDDRSTSNKKTIIDASSASASIQTIYVHPSLANGIKLYTNLDKGPFIVHVSRSEPDPAAGTSIRPIKFGQFLFQNNIQNICTEGVKKVGRNKISVEFKTTNSANEFLQNPLLISHKYIASVPTYNVTRMGLIRGVPVDWSMDELVESLQLPDGCGNILKARRLNRKIITDGNPSWIPTQSVVLTFQGQIIPERVFSYHTSLIVEPYQFPTIQCMNCCRFGHIKAQCRSKPRCYRCAQPHTGDACDVLEEQSTCLFCSGRHFSTNKSCPEQGRQKSIKVIMSQECISYEEASTQLPHVGRSYADVTKAPVPASSPHPVSELTPSTSYTKTVYRNPRPRTIQGTSYDRSAHQSIISNPSSSLPNGSALLHSQQPQNLDTNSTTISPNENLLDLLLAMIINMIAKYSDSLPSNVADKLTLISSFLHTNGPVGDRSMEH